MKQGKASRDVRESAYRDPRANAINPRWTSQIGQSYGNHATEHAGLLPRDKVIEKMHQGRGFNAPRDASREIHKSGSQRRS